jgi:DNA-binding NarL/FixJ family response regulator
MTDNLQQPNNRKLNILIVDDNSSFVDRMIGLLDEVNNINSINIASNYEEARRFLAADPHDLVLLDINLPGKNGIELLKQIKAKSEDCQVIMITNHADDYYRVQCKQYGADHFLDKSNEFSRVPGIISKLNANAIEEIVLAS